MSKEPSMSRCINCRGLPTIVKQPGYYRWRLDHNNPMCPPQFGIETHQHTRAACIASWNAHNVRRAQR